jgi:hypothetical protein
MQSFVAIIGNQNSGKSTVIKSLTGCHANNFRGFVVDKATNESIYVVCSSPQEMSIGLKSIGDLRKILSLVKSSKTCRGIVMAIQPSRPTAKLSMETILAEVQLHPFHIFAYVLDPGHNGPSVALPIVNARLASHLITSQALDGRRFAHRNAEIVNSITRIAS